MAMPTWVADGTTIDAACALLNVPLPAGIQENDILLLFLCTQNEAIAIADAGGGTWTEVTNSPQGTGTAAGTTATRLTVFWSRYNGTQTEPDTTDSGNSQGGFISAFRGVKTTGDPFNISSGNVDATSDTSLSATGATTTAANCLVVIAAALMDDAQNFGATWTNSDLSNITTRTNFGFTGGNDGRVIMLHGEKAAAGTYGATTNTLTANSVKGMMTIALEGASGSTQDGAAALTATGTISVIPQKLRDGVVVLNSPEIVSVSAYLEKSGQSQLLTVSNLTTLGEVERQAILGEASLIVTASINTLAEKLRSGDCVLTTSFTTFVSATQIFSVSSLLQSTSSIQVDATKIIVSQVNITGLTTVNTNVSNILIGDSQLISTETLGISAEKIVNTACSLTSTENLSVLSGIIINASIGLISNQSLVVSASVFGNILGEASLVSNENLTVLSSPILVSKTELLSTGSLSATGSVLGTITGESSLSTTANLNIKSSSVIAASCQQSSVQNLTTQSSNILTGRTSFNNSGQLTCTAEKLVNLTSLLNGSANINVSVNKLVSADTSISSVGTLNCNSERVLSSACVLTNENTLTCSASRFINGFTTCSIIALLTTEGGIIEAETVGGLNIINKTVYISQMPFRKSVHLGGKRRS